MFIPILHRLHAYYFHTTKLCNTLIYQYTLLGNIETTLMIPKPVPVFRTNQSTMYRSTVQPVS